MDKEITESYIELIFDFVLLVVYSMIVSLYVEKIYGITIMIYFGMHALGKQT